MKRALLLTILLTGCATQSGVLPEGQDSYLLIMSSGYGLASSADLKIDAHKEASAFCAKLGKQPETVYENTSQSGAVSDFHEEYLKFRCVAAMNTASAPAAAPPVAASAASAASGAVAAPSGPADAH